MLAIYLTLIDNEDDKKSFEDLYNQNRSKAYAIAFNILKNKTLAEEACSETFFSLAKSFQKIKNLESHKLDYYIVIMLSLKSQFFCFNLYSLPFLRQIYTLFHRRFEIKLQPLLFKTNKNDGVNPKCHILH